MSTFHNPILRGFNPDPTVCVVPATSTQPTRFFLSTSTFEYTPSCPIYTSTDLLNWTLVGHALTRPSQLNLRTVEPGAGSWASTLRYREKEGRFYLTTGVFQRYRPGGDERVFPRGFYVHTTDPFDSSSWSDPVYFDNPGFDQDLFWDDEGEGKVYLSTTVRINDRDPQSALKDFAIHISEIDIASGRTLSPPVVIRKSEFGVAEGSHILFKDPYYYLFVAEGGTEAGHQEWVFRSKHGVYGPWESQGRALWYNGADEEVQRTGHADVFCDGEGRWWGVFLGVRPLRLKRGGGIGRFLEPQLGRETFLVTVDWIDDWPVFNGGANITLLTAGRDDVVQAIEAPRSPGEMKWTASLSLPELELGWYTRLTPLKSFHCLASRPGHLRLHGTCYPLSSREAPALLLRKQTEYNESFHATLDFKPSRKGYEAGITVYWSPYGYASIGICALEHEGKVIRTIVCRKPEGKAGVFTTTYPLLSSSPAISLQDREMVELCAEASDTEYKLYLKHARGVTSFAFGSEELAVMPPVGGAFTGTMFGVYSFGNWEPVLDPADFSEICVRQGLGRGLEGAEWAW